jgi:hypothetical protein
LAAAEVVVAGLAVAIAAAVVAAVAAVVETAMVATVIGMETTSHSMVTGVGMLELIGFRSVPDKGL